MLSPRAKLAQKLEGLEAALSGPLNLSLQRSPSRHLYPQPAAPLNLSLQQPPSRDLSPHRSPDARPLMLFEESLSFYSHTKRTEAEKARDDELNIDRRCLSNLWTGVPNEEPERMMVGKIDIRLIGHAFLQNTRGSCTEAWFQSAKCKDERAAYFCFHLKDPKDCAQFGRGQLPLTETQSNHFTNLGMPLAEIDSKTKTLINDRHAHAAYIKKWMTNICENFENRRASNPTEYNHIFTVYVPEMRDTWEDIKYELMFELVKAKFGARGGQARANDTARRLARKNILHATEHANDTIWGDGVNGMGKNCLGKLISAVLTYMRINSGNTDNLHALKWSVQSV